MRILDTITGLLSGRLLREERERKRQAAVAASNERHFAISEIADLIGYEGVYKALELGEPVTAWDAATIRRQMTDKQCAEVAATTPFTLAEIEHLRELVRDSLARYGVRGIDVAAVVSELASTAVKEGVSPFDLAAVIDWPSLDESAATDCTTPAAQ